MIPSGARVGLVGPNGSGKTTLMRIMMGLINFKGRVEIAGKSIVGFDETIRNESAYVSQIAPYFSSKVREIVSTILKIRKGSFDAFEQILKRLYLPYPEVADYSFRELSGGMKQKLMIALAFFFKPSLVFLDEPTASLDAKSREAFYRLCKDLTGKVTFILSSHRIEEIRHIITHCIELEKGEIVFEGTTKQYLQEKTMCLLEVFFKKPGDANKKKLQSMGFSLSYSGWWSLLLPQEEKLRMLHALQSFFPNAIENLIVRDVDVEK